MDEQQITESRRLSEEFHRLKDLCHNETMTLNTIIQSLPPRSHGLVTLVFAIPFVSPIPMPGLSLLFGLIIIVGGIGISLGKAPWLPKFLLHKDVSSKTLKKIFDFGIRVSRSLEKFIRPRGVFLLRHPWARQFCGVMIAICGFLLALPLPPGTNFPPATAILLLSIGSLEEDIVLVLAGYVAFAINIILFSLLAIYGYDGVKIFLNYFGLV